MEKENLIEEKKKKKKRHMNLVCLAIRNNMFLLNVNRILATLKLCENF